MDDEVQQYVAGIAGVAGGQRRGRTMVTAQTNVYDDRERLVAQTTQVQAVRAGRQE